MDDIIGQCGNCGGNVVVPSIWWGINPPEPQCNRCGAIAKKSLPVIDMGPSKDKKHDFNPFVEDKKPPQDEEPPNDSVKLPRKSNREIELNCDNKRFLI